MKFSAVATILAAAASAHAAVLAPRAEIDCIGGTRDIALERNFVGQLVNKCTETKTPGNPWATKACVAAAVVAGPATLRDVISCSEPTIPDEKQFPNLDYNVYASIVGDCAWAPNGCDVTRQNLIDLVYGTISTVSKPVWPESVEVLTRFYINPIFSWTATSPTNSSTPYTNFNDWLHYVGPISTCAISMATCPW